MLARNRRLFVLMLSTAVVAGCGDDDTAPTDAGVDAASAGDAGLDAGATLDAGVDEDAGPGDGGSPFASCDPYTADSCGAGMKCVVVARMAEPMSFAFVVGCVPSSLGLAAEGLPCTYADATPADTSDSWVASNCRQGLSCSQNGHSYSTCNRICDAAHACGADELCGLFDTAGMVPGSCSTWSACDPVLQTGCAADQQCSVFFDGDTVHGVSACGPPGTTPVGDPCPGFAFEVTTPCVPGSQCYASPLPDGGTDGDYRCRAYCALGPTVDAGTPDGGVADAGLTGTCPGGETCVAPGEWLVIRSPTPAGICH